MDRFIFRATIVYQATKHFQGNKSDSEESGWRVDDCRQTVLWEFIGKFTRGVVGVVSAKRMHNTEQDSRGLACAKLPTESNCFKLTVKRSRFYNIRATWPTGRELS